MAKKYTESAYFENAVQAEYKNKGYIVGHAMSIKKWMQANGYINEDMFCPIPDGIKVRKDGSLDIIEIKYRRVNKVGSVDEKFMTADAKKWAWENVHNMKINSYTYICSSFFAVEEKMALYRKYLTDHSIEYIIKNENDYNIKEIQRVDGILET